MTKIFTFLRILCLYLSIGTSFQCLHFVCVLRVCLRSHHVSLRRLRWVVYGVFVFHSLSLFLSLYEVNVVNLPHSLSHSLTHSLTLKCRYPLSSQKIQQEQNYHFKILWTGRASQYRSPMWTFHFWELF